jgi:hypothetical protein
VSISAPVTGATFTAPATIRLTAATTGGAGTIAEMDYYNGTTLLGTGSTTAPFTLDVPGVQAGVLNLTANAYTSLGLSAVSSSVTVTVVSLSDGNLGSGGTMADALRALMIASGVVTPTLADYQHGDVAPLVGGKPQPDGKIDIGDVLVILRKVVGLVSW